MFKLRKQKSKRKGLLWIKNSIKNGYNKQFIAISYKKSLNFEIISVDLNQSNNCCLFFLKIKI